MRNIEPDDSQQATDKEALEQSIPQAGAHEDPTRPPERGQPAPTAEESSPAPSEYFLAGVAATGLSAVVVAVLTSFAGLQGTAIGAMLGAMGGSVVSQVAKKPLSRVEHRARGLLASLRRLGPHDLSRLARSIPSAAIALGRRIPKRTLLSTIAIGVGGFALGMTAVSAFETAQGQPLSAITAGEPETGTTIGNLIAQLPSDATTVPSTAVPDGRANVPALEPPLMPPTPAGSSPVPTSPTAALDDVPATVPVTSPVASPTSGPAASPAASPAREPPLERATPTRVVGATATSTVLATATPSATPTPAVPRATSSPAATSPPPAR